ncbi:uncharacterized protein CC84DRAFT_461169 [Paraphaeosphaeria sporulosa]|uniref:Uncharacterized protein n=1 Tax=Paraphaeosphaeria sporulosa TaxID=1460663 RepID=A0A177CTF0_9PLEO|nr:uncharacterized protein CC84DRAFT_461169 [Paraphaeosphaeria sporulosa]OAG10057.1 hypothetical protein CC84DRAFT_461169 [Paraphaeosphaeria sporulosa]
MYSNDPSTGNHSLFAPSMGRQVSSALPSSAFPPLPGTKFKLNPRAPPFIPRALVHPPTAVSPTKSDMSLASTVVSPALLPDWRPFAPRVPVTDPYGAGIFAHPGPAAPAVLAQASRFPMGGGPWNIPHPYGWAQPFFATAPQHLAYGGTINDGFSGARKGKKKGSKGKGKRPAW